MTEHYRTLSAVFPMIFRTANGKRQVLLHQRANTGYMDGMWDIAGSGHVDENETATQAVARECGEELGIGVNPEQVSFAHLCHRLGRSGGRTYYDLYFVVESFQGVPVIAEPEKCTGLDWFDLEDLPPDMIGIRKKVLEQYLQAVPYSEIVE